MVIPEISTNSHSLQELDNLKLSKSHLILNYFTMKSAITPFVHACNIMVRFQCELDLIYKTSCAHVRWILSFVPNRSFITVVPEVHCGSCATNRAFKVGFLHLIV